MLALESTFTFTLRGGWTYQLGHWFAAASAAGARSSDDSEDDIFLMRRVFKDTGFPVDLHSVENGEECLAFLHKESRYAAAPTPDLILLDLNMPVLDGRQVLTTMVADPCLRALPVVVLTTSTSQESGGPGSLDRILQLLSEGLPIMPPVSAS